MDLKASQVSGFRAIEWKEEVLRKLVFRQLGGCGDDQGMTYDNFLRHHHEILHGAGFHIHSTPYAMRRGTANAIENKVTVARRMQVMGHTEAKIFAKHYISKTIFSDVQSSVQDEEEKSDLIKQAQRLSNWRDESAPVALCSKDMSLLEEDQDLKQQ